MDFVLLGLSATAGARPTYFELAAQATLTDAVKPVLRHVLAVFGERHPGVLSTLFNYVDELYAVLTALVERHYLATKGGAFAEYFYGLKRAVVVNAVAVRPMNSTDRRRALLVLVLVPYLHAKLEAYFAALGGTIMRDLPLQPPTVDADEGTTERPRESWASFWRRLFVVWYPRLSSAYAVVALAYQVAFIFNRTRYYTPWLHLLGQEIQRLTPNDAALAERDARIAARYPGADVLSLLQRTLALAVRKSLDGIQTLFPIAIFFIKFLQWWYSPGQGRLTASSADLVPSPPEFLPPAPDGIGLPASPADCPICRRTRTNPATLPSGYVFCYPCIHAYVETHVRCPVTLIPAELDDIRKLYLG